MEELALTGAVPALVAIDVDITNMFGVKNFVLTSKFLDFGKLVDIKTFWTSEIFLASKTVWRQSPGHTSPRQLRPGMAMG